MDRVLLAVFALLSFYVAYAYLLNQELAARWETSRRRTLGQDDLIRDSKWESRARFRGMSALILGLFLLAIVTGVL
ncbi:MAG: hypothetical protein K8J31_16800 [Anaerolineae bacterium]|nr:hypothetical protein [Anaerolineae bacterium]